MDEEQRSSVTYYVKLQLVISERGLCRNGVLFADGTSLDCILIVCSLSLFLVIMECFHLYIGQIINKSEYPACFLFFGGKSPFDKFWLYLGSVYSGKRVTE